jgi:hypothetical protein
VKVIGTVFDATRAEVTSRSEVRVERLMVDEPITTISEEVSLDDETDVLTELVIVEPSLLVVVIATEICVGTSEVGALEGGAAVSWADELGMVEDGAGEDGAVLAGGALLAEDIIEDDSVGLVVSAVVVEDEEEVTPVPTACLLFGLMPSGILSAPICANPRNNESMVALITPSPADWASKTPTRGR